MSNKFPLQKKGENSSDGEGSRCLLTFVLATSNIFNAPKREARARRVAEIQNLNLKYVTENPW